VRARRSANASPRTPDERLGRETPTLNLSLNFNLDFNLNLNLNPTLEGE
jgi:hypothetical protein